QIGFCWRAKRRYRSSRERARPLGLRSREPKKTLSSPEIGPRRGLQPIIIDDPLKPDEALSTAQRNGTNAWYDHTLYSRLNDKRHGAIVIIMQRLHEDDLVGHVLAQEPWEVLSFSASAETDEVHEIETIWGRRCFRRRW